MRIGRETRVGALVVAVAALVLGSTTSAGAAEPTEIEISTDGGETWYLDGAPALFANLGEVTPGQSQSASIEVRNTSAVDSVLRLAQIVAVSATPGFVVDLNFEARTTAVAGPLVQNVALGVCTPLLNGQQLEAGQTATIDLTIALDESAGNGSQAGVAPIAFYISLVEDTGGALPPVSCAAGASAGGDRPSTMPNTGADWMPVAATGGALAVALLGGGILAMLTGRRRRHSS